MLLLGNIWTSNISYTVYSPDEAHYAEVTDYRTGLDSGTSSYVKIYENNGVDLFFIKIKKNVKMPHGREYGKVFFRKVFGNVHWRDNNILVVDGTAYLIYNGECTLFESDPR